jgi:hypothetical protein
MLISTNIILDIENSNRQLNSCNACVCEDFNPQGMTITNMTKSNQIF